MWLWTRPSSAVCPWCSSRARNKAVTASAHRQSVSLVPANCKHKKRKHKQQQQQQQPLISNYWHIPCSSTRDLQCEKIWRTFFAPHHVWCFCCAPGRDHTRDLQVFRSRWFASSEKSVQKVEDGACGVWVRFTASGHVDSVCACMLILSTNSGSTEMNQYGHNVMARYCVVILRVRVGDVQK